jgi:RHS repeat-associated protein
MPSKVLSTLSVLIAVCSAAICAAQIPSETDVTSTPVPDVGHDFIHAPVETVNPANGSLSIRIGVPIPPSRGFSLPFNFAYDSNGVFYLNCGRGSLCSNSLIWATGNSRLSQGGWSYSAPMLSVQESEFSTVDGNGKPVTCYDLNNFVMQDLSGNRRNIGLTNYGTSAYCGLTSVEGPVTSAQEGSLLSQTGSQFVRGTAQAVTVTDGDGTVYAFPAHTGVPIGYCGPTCGPATYPPTAITDRNGNTTLIYSYTGVGGPILTYTDTNGRTALNIPTFGGSPDSVTVSGLSSPYKVYWTTIQANFSVNFDHIGGDSCTGTGSPGSQPTISAVSSIVLPNQESYTFSYDSVYGLIDKITYPTGAYVRYVWGTNSQSEYGQWPYIHSDGSSASCDYYYDSPAIAHRYVSFDGVHEVLQQDFTYSTTFGTPGYPISEWSQKTTTVITHDLARGSNYQFKTVYNYLPAYADYQPNTGGLQAQVPVEHTISYYDTNGTLLKTIGKTWGNERMLTQQTETLVSGGVSETDFSYNQYEMETNRYDYNYGSGSRGSLLRQTVIPSYHTFTKNGVNLNILDKPDQVQVKDGSGNVAAGATYGYDGVGNMLSRSNWLNSTGSSTLTTSHTYDAYGNIITTLDPKGNTTNYSYADQFVDTCTYTAPANAYLTKITYPTTNGVPHVENFQYKCASGKLANSIDENAQTSSYQYNDPFLRITQIQGPPDPNNGNQSSTMTYSYNDAGPNPTVTTSELMNTSGGWKTNVSTMDGIGHVIQTALEISSQETDSVYTSYDGEGFVWTVSNPTSATPTLFTAYTYDPLGLKLLQTNQDGSQRQWCFDGNRDAGQTNCNAAVVTGNDPRIDSADENGNDQQTISDALGRLTTVGEPNGVSAQPSSPANSMITSYTYSALGDLRTVSQNGRAGIDTPRPTRTFNYDMLSRLTSAYNLESGWTCYGTTGLQPANASNCTPGYDANGNLTYKTDARGIQIGYSYDALNRLLGKNYAAPNTPPAGYAATAPVSYTYDQGPASANPIGRMSSMTDGPGSESWTYDPMGRIAGITRSTLTPQSNQNFAASFQYNLDGTLNTSVVSTEAPLQYLYDTVGRQTGVHFVGNNNYMLSGGTYDPAQHLISLNYGILNYSAVQLINSTQYNSRLQPSQFLTTLPAQTLNGQQLNAQTVYSHTLCYTSCYSGAPTINNGNIQSDTDNVASANSAVYKYDTLNRLISAQATNQWGDAYTYDGFGNLYQKTPIGGGVGETLQAQPTSQNQLANIGLAYDAAGNVLTDNMGTHYTYDAENRIATAGSWSYSYDGRGKRVLRTSGGATGSTYWYGADDTLMEEQSVALNNGIPAQYQKNIYLDGRLTARMEGNSSSPRDYHNYWIVADQVGSTRVAADWTWNPATGANPPIYDNYYPFGGSITTPIDTTLEQRFTGKIRDTETGNDYFGARYYTSSMGRLLSPDWAAKPEGSNPVPYANLEYPQTLNLYSYAGNNPLSRTDPDGHCTNGGQQQGFFWCLFHDSDQDADRARKQLAAYKNISINGKTPADAAKGLSNTQTVQLERSVFNYISSQAMRTPGMMFALAIVPGGVEKIGPLEIAVASDRAVAAGEATQWLVQTGKSALATDIRTNITAAEFGTNLEASGFVKSVAKDGATTLYSKGNQVYSIYKDASFGGTSANLAVDGNIVTKIRLQ